MSPPRQRLSPEGSKTQFEAQVNRAAKAIRAIAKSVEENPTHFVELTIEKTRAYLHNQIHQTIWSMRSALTAADPARAPFSLDADYVPKIDPNRGTTYTSDTAPRSRPLLDEAATALPPSGARPKPVGRLVKTEDNEKGAVVFAIDAPKAARPIGDDPDAKTDKTGMIINAGFIED